MQWLRKPKQELHISPFWIGMLVLILLMGNALLYAVPSEAREQAFSRVVEATLGIVIVDPKTGQGRAFVCAPVTEVQQEEVPQ